MNKQEFLKELSDGLTGLPHDDINERLNFYAEMIDDHVEDGLSEEEAIAEIGNPEKIAIHIIEEYPISKLVKEKVRPKRSLRTWEIILLILGSPIWASLLIILFALLLVIYIVIWVLVIVLWAVFAVFIVCALACIAAGIYFIFHGEPLPGITVIGAALLLAGLAIFLFFGCKAASKGAVRLIKLIFKGIKSLFIGKENTK